MQCFVCGEQMRVVGVEPHVVDVLGFEFRTFQCVGCGDVETRTVFDSALAGRASAPLPKSAMPKSVMPKGELPESATPAAAPSPVAASKMRSIIGTLVRFRSTPHP